jgi:hypothetical protein
MKTNKLKLSMALLIPILFSVGLFLYFHQGVMDSISSRCNPIAPLSESQKLIGLLDNNSYAFSSSTKEIYNESSEGGIQINYTNNSGQTQIIEQRLYGAIGRTFMRFYLKDQKIFALAKLDEHYKNPISADRDVVISKTEEEDYYFSSNGRVCGWMLNGLAQQIGTTTQEMIQSFVSNIRK